MSRSYPGDGMPVYRAGSGNLVSGDYSHCEQSWIGLSAATDWRGLTLGKDVQVADYEWLWGIYTYTTG